MAILSNLTERCVLCKIRLCIGIIVNEKLKIGVWVSFFCFLIQNIKFKILNGRTVHGPVLFSSFSVYAKFIMLNISSQRLIWWLDIIQPWKKIRGEI